MREIRHRLRAALMKLSLIGREGALLSFVTLTHFLE